MISALVGHLVGDYLLQNDWMALNKKASFLPCFVHCLIWTACVVLFSGWFALPPVTLGAVVFTLFASHFAQDHTTIIRRWMSLIGQDKFATGPCSPWSIIVVDNVWHIVTIWAVWQAIEASI